MLSKGDGEYQSFKSFECLKRHHLSTILAGMEDEEKKSNIGTYIAGFVSQLSLALSSGKKGSLDLVAVFSSLLSLMSLVEILGCILLKKNLLLLLSWRFLNLILKRNSITTRRSKQ